jgi:5-formyltetrahydrofolate cyclo-ligase
MNLPLHKPSLRKQLLTQRRSLSPQDWRRQSDRICHHLQTDDQFKSAKTVLAYFSTQQEADLSGLWTESIHNHAERIGVKRFGFPICEGQQLLWRAWKLGDTVVVGAFGILEPDRSGPIILPEQVDLMLVPWVGCDHAGYRLGYGGGFYDRLLANPAWRSVPTIGIGFGFGLLEQLPIEPWDLPLSRICTDQGFL